MTTLKRWNGTAWEYIGLPLAPNDPWTAWAPTWSNLTVGNGTVTARYMRVGRTIHYFIKFLLGSTSSVSTGPTFTLPVALAASYVTGGQGDSIGDVRVIDSGTADYSGQVFASSSTTGRIIVGTAGGAYTSFTDINGTTPMTWTTSDAMMAWGTYEATS